MGINVATQEIMRSFEVFLRTEISQSATASSLSNCRVNIGSVTFKENNNCNVNIENYCTATSSAAVESIQTAMQSVIDQLTITQQQALATALGINVSTSSNNQSIYQHFESLIEQECNVSSVINSVVTVQSIQFDKCSSTSGLTINIINTGHAVSNCGLKVLNDLFLESVTESDNNTDQTISLFPSNFFSDLLKPLTDLIKGSITTIATVVFAIVFVPIILIVFASLIKKLLGILSRQAPLSSKSSHVKKLMNKSVNNNMPIHWSIFNSFI